MLAGQGQRKNQCIASKTVVGKYLLRQFMDANNEWNVGVLVGGSRVYRLIVKRSKGGR